MKNKYYAVFDWDNTVRHGFTMFDWIDYLCDIHVIEDTLKDSINEFSLMYQRKEISHDDYARLACREYAKYLAGIKVEDLKRIAEGYFETDMSNLFSGIEEIFIILKKCQIDIIIVSGAPEIILNMYKDRFGFSEVFSFKEDEHNGVYTGQVAYNYGYNKKLTMEQLESMYASRPLLGFGDSSSDYPLLDYSEYSYILNNDYNRAIRINTIGNSISAEIIKDIKTTLADMGISR